MVISSGRCFPSGNGHRGPVCAVFQAGKKDALTAGVRYGITVPGLPGCFSAGDTLDEALDSVREAIDLHLEGMAEEGTPLPEPRLLAEYQSDPDYASGVWAVVEVERPALKAKRRRST